MTTVSALIYGTERAFIDSYSTYSTVSVALLPLLYPALIIKVITQYVDRWKPSAVSLHSSARVFLHIRVPPCFFIPSSVSQRSIMTRTKQHRFKTLKKLKKTHLCGGNHHNLLKVIKCHFVATRCGPLTARGKDRSSLRWTGRDAGNSCARFSAQRPLTAGGDSK